MIRKSFLFTVMVLFVFSLGAMGGGVQSQAQTPAGTAFTYQGRLTDSGAPAEGDYDFQFKLFDDQGNQVGATLTRDDIPVRDGMFTLSLDFGEVFDGQGRWLEVSVRAGNVTTGYVTLTPRHPLTPTPYALALPDVYPMGGNVGIGTATPSFPLSLGSSTARTKLALYETGPDNSYGLGVVPGAFRLHLNGSGARFGFLDGDDDTATEIVTIQGNGNMGIGTTNPAFKLDVAGAAHASSFPTSSDVRLKQDVAPLTGVLDRLAKVRGVTFEWNDTYAALGRSTGRREIGVIAQELEAVFPELVTTWGDKGYRAVDYGRLTAVLIEALKELRVEKETQIAVLEQKNADLEQRVETLEALVNTLAAPTAGGEQ
jgi:hypothetical protein